MRRVTAVGTRRSDPGTAREPFTCSWSMLACTLVLYVPVEAEKVCGGCDGESVSVAVAAWELPETATVAAFPWFDRNRLGNGRAGRPPRLALASSWTKYRSPVSTCTRSTSTSGSGRWLTLPTYIERARSTRWSQSQRAVAVELECTCVLCVVWCWSSCRGPDLLAGQLARACVRACVPEPV